MKLQYQLLGITKQAFYKRQRSQLFEAKVEAEVCGMVRNIRRLMPRIGARKIHYLIKDQLHEKQLRIGRDKLFSILRKHLLLVPRRRKYHPTTQSKHQYFKYPNLIKDLKINQSEQVWVADITYIRTSQGFRYLHLITDAYSKQIMGYQLSPNMKIETALETLRSALNKRQYNHQLIHHSDRGLQYAHNAYTQLLKDHQVLISMTTQYDPYENAIAERVNGILKDEFDIGEGFLNQQQAHKWIEESVKLYNNLRPHLSCGMLTPVQAHQANVPLKRYWK